MTNENKQFTSKIKSYHIFILGCLLSSLLILNSNYANNQRATEKLNREKSKLFDKIISGRKLDGEETTEGEEETNNEDLTYSDKICKKGTEELYKYYKSGGDLSLIDIKDGTIEVEDKDKDYFKSLINIIKAMTDEEDDDTSSEGYPETNYNDEEDNFRNLEMSLDDIQDDIIGYGKHILPFIVFFVVAILCIPGWIVCCFCCCCNCCCCCCCKKPCCKLPCFIVTYVFYALVVAVCIYGLTQSNKVFIGLNDTECSLLKFFDQFLDGETKKELPRWAGISGITDILDGLYNQIEYLRDNTKTNLDTQMRDISTKKNEFLSKMNSSDGTFYETNGNIKNDYLVTYNYDSGSYKVTGTYVLDLIYLLGKYDKVNQKYEPEGSALYLWEREYKGVSEIADKYLDIAQSGFTEILSDSSSDILDSLKGGNETLGDLKSSFDDIKSSIADMIIENSETIDDYGKLGFKAIFGVLGLINIAIAVFMVLICLFSGKMCKNCCCCRCIFKFFTHLLWNILALLMIITFLVGSLFGLIGQIGSDAMSVISYIVSEDNLGKNGTGGDNILVGSLGEAKGYLDTCVNGDGRIEEEIGLEKDQIDKFNDLYTAEETINQTRDNFTEMLDMATYKYYKGEAEKRENLTTSPQLYKLNNNNLDITGTLDFSTILTEMNAKIADEPDVSKKQERWVTNSNSNNICGPLNDDDSTIGSNKEFNPLKCSPYHRDWIQSSSNEEINRRAKILTDMLKSVNKDNDNSNANKFLRVLQTLSEEYLEYLNQYIDTLDLFGGSIHKITGKLREYTSDDDGIFSFIKCSFIGTNLKIILKYLKTALGDNIKTVGICLIVAGCSLALSISITILMIVIINTGLKNNNENNQNEQIPEYPVNSSGRVIQYRQ